MVKKHIRIYILLIVIMLLLTACRSRDSMQSRETDLAQSTLYEQETMSEETQSEGGNETEIQPSETNDEQSWQNVTSESVKDTVSETISVAVSTEQITNETSVTQQQVSETTIEATEETTEETTTKSVQEETQPVAVEEETEPTIAAGTPYEAHGKLSVSGTQLVDTNGEAFQLRGVSTHGLSWFPQYVNYDAFKEIRDGWGANAMRLAMYTGEGGYCQGSDADRQNLLNLIDTGVQAATELGMYIIIDWHILSDGNPNTYADMAADFFEQVSYKYKDYGNIIYEICNEPNGGTSWNDIKSYAERIIPIIKNNCPDAVIVVGTPTWSQDVDIAAGNPITGYSNIMYALHFYADTHRDSLRNKLITAVNAGLPIMVTEFGICDASGAGANNISEGNTWINTLDGYGISYFAWNLSNKNEASAFISNYCQKTNGWSEDELSESGRWYKGILQARRDSSVQLAPSQNNSSTEMQSQQSSQENSWQQTEQATTQSTEKHSSQQSVENCVATAAKSNGWGSDGEVFSQYGIELSNLGSIAVDNWCVELTFNQNVSISQFWCCNAEADGNIIRLIPAEYNATIEAGEVRSDIGIIISAATEPVIEKIELK